MSEKGEIYTAGKNFTLPPALTAWTNSTSEYDYNHSFDFFHDLIFSFPCHVSRYIPLNLFKSSPE